MSDIDPRETDERLAQAAQRDAEDARREAETLRRDREKADRQATREAEKARRDQEKADRTAQKDVERLQKEARDAAREAGRALREAEQADRQAALARQRAARETDKARRQAQRAEPDGPSTGLAADLPPDIAVLWRTPAPARRGPRPGLSLEQIADAAIALADAEGLDAVSMARLAESLGFTTMSLYRYVSSKDEVLMLMSDRAAGRPPVVGPEVGDWRARMEVLLGLMAPVLRQHPWMSRTTSLLFAVGPNRLEWMEQMMAALSDTPLHEADKLRAVGALSSHQLEWARFAQAETTRAQDVARARAGSGAAGGGRAVSGSAGGDAAADDAVTSGFAVADDSRPDAVIERLVDPERHPAMTRAVVAGVFAGGEDLTADDELDFGTRLILDGIDALVRASH